jgi:thioredoxin reductase (NADPH)
MEKKFVNKGEKVSHEKVYHYDVLILGAGPAGMTAGIYASRYHLKTLIISKDIGGTANWAEKLENYPGYMGNGRELMQKFKAQAEKLGTEFLMEEIFDISKDENGFIVHTQGKEIHSNSLIIATGMKRKELEIPGEEKFKGKGVSYCVTCDARLFKGKDVLVVGGSDAAAHVALLLAEYTNNVYISFRKPEMKAEAISIKKLKENKKIKLLPETIPVEIKGKNMVESITLDNKGKKQEIKLQGIFIEIGGLPVTQIISQLGIKTVGDYIVADREMCTNIKGIFAAGDVINRKFKQIVTAASDGAIAAKSAYDCVKN